MSDVRTAPRLPAAVIWHDAECGAYRADLPTWERLAAEHPGMVLDLGAGTGRVALHLAARGVDLVAVERDRELLEALQERAAERSLHIEAIDADVRELALSRSFGLIIAPMQLAHLLGGTTGRNRAWVTLAAHLRAGGVIALALLEEPLPRSGRPEPLPDVREADGWVHSSLPLDVRVLRKSVELDRLRQIVSPDGTLTEELHTTRLDRIALATLELELVDAGLTVIGTESIAETADHVTSRLVLIGASS